MFFCVCIMSNIKIQIGKAVQFHRSRQQLKKRSHLSDITDKERVRHGGKTISTKTSGYTWLLRPSFSLLPSANNVDQLLSRNGRNPLPKEFPFHCLNYFLCMLTCLVTFVSTLTSSRQARKQPIQFMKLHLPSLFHTCIELRKKKIK
jgi:hypothetical protein